MMGRSRARRGGRKGVDFENWEKPVEETGDADMIPNKDSSDSVSGWPPRADSQPARCGGWGSTFYPGFWLFFAAEQAVLRTVSVSAVIVITIEY